MNAPISNAALLRALAVALAMSTAPALAQTTDEKLALGQVAFEDGDYAKALTIWEELAAEGNPEALRSAAQLYRLGLGTERDNSRAFDYYLEAAEKGLAAAQVNVAFLQLTGEGTAKDEREAARWFARAADQGDPLAQFNLGLMYENGVGLPVDKQLATELYQLAASQGQKRAMERLAAIDGVDEDPTTQSAAERSDDARERDRAAESDRETARSDTVKMPPMNKPGDKAEPQQEDSDEASKPVMRGTVSISPSKPSLREDSVKDAEDAKETASKSPLPEAKPRREREPMPAALSPAEELNALMRAAEANDPRALFALGRLYNTGKGVEQDRLAAYSLWRAAAAMGSERAATALANLSMQMTPTQLSEAEQQHRASGRPR